MNQRPRKSVPGIRRGNIGEHRTRVTSMLLRDTLAVVDALAKQRGHSRSRVVASLITTALKDYGHD
jgi:hypothetical protein